MKRIWVILSILAACVLAGAFTLQLSNCSKIKSVKLTEKTKAALNDSISKVVWDSIGSGWHYGEEQDQMGRGTIKTAFTFSLNTVSFDFPYQGKQRGSLALRSHPRHGNAVMFAIEKGQFQTGIDGCRVMVRFDDDKPVAFWANEPETQNTTVLFIQGYSKFVARLMRAQKVLIEAPFFQEGNQVFEFKVDSLKWSQPTPPLTEKQMKEGEKAREKALSDSFDANPYYHPR